MFARYFTLILTIAVLSLPVFAQNLLEQPESVVYDLAENRYLVSNYESGNIVQIDSNEVQSYYSTQFAGHGLVGMHILGDKLYVSVNAGPQAGVAELDLATGDLIRLYNISYNGLLNDITSDANGYVYVTDYWDSKLFKIYPEENIYTMFASSNLNYPNGICYDPVGNRLLVCSNTGPGIPILSVSVEDSSVVILTPSGLDGMDGITMDSENNIYVSEWTNNTVCRYNYALTSGPIVVSSGHNAPADIYFDQHNSILCVPNFYENTVDFVPMPGSDVEDKKQGHLLPSKLQLKSYPNPFNQRVALDFMLPAAADINLKIYDITGREVEALGSGYWASGRHCVPWDASGQSSGVYFARLSSGLYSETEKLILLK